MAVILLTILLLSAMFLAGLFSNNINYLNFLPSKKLIISWIPSFAAKNPPILAPNPITPQVTETPTGQSTRQTKSVFATFDKNGDGFITKEELRDSFKDIRMLVTEKELEEMVVKVDSNGDGLIDFDEFCLLCEAMEVKGGDGKESGGVKEVEGDDDLKEAFDVFDNDGDGLISVEELSSVLSSMGLKEGKRVEDCKEMIRKVDMDGDGMVNFDEFKRMMRGGGGGGGELVSVF